MASSKVSQQNLDFISNVPDIVAHKILELLPIQMAARTSVLSKQCRGNWLSLQCLDFSEEFCEELENEDGRCNGHKWSNIISSILIHHNGHVHDVHLLIPEGTDDESLNVGQWLCFLSENAVKRITVRNWAEYFYISPYIFNCSELVYLHLDDIGLDPPTDFVCFPKLRHLVLMNMDFDSDVDILYNLMANCPVLATLNFENFYGSFDIVIEAPTLETLIINGHFESLTFKDARSLRSASLCLYKMEPTPIDIDRFDAANLLASSSQLQCIQLAGKVCKYIAAGKIPRPFPVSFNNLSKLCLGDVNLDNFREVDYVFGMIESCPYMKELSISLRRSDLYSSRPKVFCFPSKPANQHKIICKCNQRLDYLLEIKISGITGSYEELNLIEYLLVYSFVLEKFSFSCGNLNTESELKLTRVLTEFPRASAKARLINCTDNMPTLCQEDYV